MPKFLKIFASGVMVSENLRSDREKIVFERKNSFYSLETVNSLFIDVAVICTSVGVHLSFVSLNGDLALYNQ